MAFAVKDTICTAEVAAERRRSVLIALVWSWDYPDQEWEGGIL